MRRWLEGSLQHTVSPLQWPSASLPRLASVRAAGAPLPKAGRDTMGTAQLLRESVSRQIWGDHSDDILYTTVQPPYWAASCGQPMPRRGRF